MRGTKAVLKERLEQVRKEEALNAQKPVEAVAKASSVNDDGGNSPRSSKPPSSVRTSVSMRSERAMEQAKHAGLLAKREALKKKHQIEAQEAELKAQEAELRKLKEELELQAEIDASEAKSKVLNQFEDPLVLFNDDAKAKAMTTEVDAEARQHTKQDVVLFNDDAKAKATTTEVDAEARQHTKQDVVLFNDDAKAKVMTTEVDAEARQHTKEDDRSRRQISFT